MDVLRASGEQIVRLYFTVNIIQSQDDPRFSTKLLPVPTIPCLNTEEAKFWSYLLPELVDRDKISVSFEIGIS
jgi:hypothetical protein